MKTLAHLENSDFQVEKLGYSKQLCCRNLVHLVAGRSTYWVVCLFQNLVYPVLDHLIAPWKWVLAQVQ
jgi:hypothetical protein